MGGESALSRVPATALRCAKILLTNTASYRRLAAGGTGVGRVVSWGVDVTAVFVAIEGR